MMSKIRNRKLNKKQNLRIISSEQTKRREEREKREKRGCSTNIYIYIYIYAVYVCRIANSHFCNHTHLSTTQKCLCSFRYGYGNIEENKILKS